MDGEGNLKSNFAGFNNDLMCASMTGKTGSKVISMCIVPVKVKHKDGKDTIISYAMLDKELGVHGMKTTLNLKTLHGKKKQKAPW